MQITCLAVRSNKEITRVPQSVQPNLPFTHLSNSETYLVIPLRANRE